jgi:hypothetical protein
MQVAALASCVFLMVLADPLMASGNREVQASRIEFPPPASPAATGSGIFGQSPSPGDWGVVNAVPADKTCDVACNPPRSRACAVASPGTDMASVLFRINRLVVWGIYKAGPTDPGSPPDEDRFTVKVQLPSGGPFDLPGPEVCSWTGIVGTRERVDEILGFSVYRHTLVLPAPCVVTAPPNRVYWIQLFNDTGPADDWFWLGGLESYAWPPDCCWEHSGYATAVDMDHAPGQDWTQVYVPLAFESRTTYVGMTQGLRVSKPSDEELLLEWDGDCGGGADFSVYRGDLVAGYSSLAPEPDLCDVSGTSATVPVGVGASDFFLVAPWVEAPYGACVLYGSEHCRSQGSYGADSDSVARPQPAVRCYWETSARHDCAP